MVNIFKIIKPTYTVNLHTKYLRHYITKFMLHAAGTVYSSNVIKNFKNYYFFTKIYFHFTEYLFIYD
jgi:hypothetical protein